MRNGFSSYQYIFGRNPNIPNVMTNTPAPLSNITINKKIADHLNVLYSARTAFIKAETSGRIRRAFHHKIRINSTYFEDRYTVHYKRKSSSKWHGLGTVTEQDK